MKIIGYNFISMFFYLFDQIREININYLIGHLISFFLVLVILIGWIVQHKSLIKSNNKNLLNIGKDRAYFKVIEDIKLYESWLSEVGFLKSKYEYHYKTCNLLNKDPYLETYNDIYQAYENRTKNEQSKWIITLENYELIFSHEIKTTRKEFVKLIIKLFDLIGSLEMCTLAYKYEKVNVKEKLLRDIFNKYEFSDLYFDFKMLINDLKKFLQEEAYGDLTNKKTEKRIPKDTNKYPYIYRRKNKLEIFNISSYIDNIRKLTKYLEKRIQELK